ncbi:hypothetical protein BJ684DRAFT_15929, partial [Piptocephalis cylindrospora]
MHFSFIKLALPLLLIPLLAQAGGDSMKHGQSSNSFQKETFDAFRTACSISKRESFYYPLNFMIIYFPYIKDLPSLIQTYSTRKELRSLEKCLKETIDKAFYLPIFMANPTSRNRYAVLNDYYNLGLALRYRLKNLFNPKAKDPGDKKIMTDSAFEKLRQKYHSHFLSDDPTNKGPIPSDWEALVGSHVDKAIRHANPTHPPLPTHQVQHVHSCLVESLFFTLKAATLDRSPIFLCLEQHLRVNIAFISFRKAAKKIGNQTATYLSRLFQSIRSLQNHLYLKQDGKDISVLCTALKLCPEIRIWLNTLSKKMHINLDEKRHDADVAALLISILHEHRHPFRYVLKDYTPAPICEPFHLQDLGRLMPNFMRWYGVGIWGRSYLTPTQRVSLDNIRKESHHLDPISRKVLNKLVTKYFDIRLIHQNTINEILENSHDLHPTFLEILNDIKKGNPQPAPIHQRILSEINGLFKAISKFSRGLMINYRYGTPKKYIDATSRLYHVMAAFTSDSISSDDFFDQEAFHDFFDSLKGISNMKPMLFSEEFTRPFLMLPTNEQIKVGGPWPEGKDTTAFFTELLFR